MLSLMTIAGIAFRDLIFSFGVSLFILLDPRSYDQFLTYA